MIFVATVPGLNLALPIDVAQLEPGVWTSWDRRGQKL